MARVLFPPHAQNPALLYSGSAVGFSTGVTGSGPDRRSRASAGIFHRLRPRATDHRLTRTGTGTDLELVTVPASLVRWLSHAWPRLLNVLGFSRRSAMGKTIRSSRSKWRRGWAQAAKSRRWASFKRTAARTIFRVLS